MNINLNGIGLILISLFFFSCQSKEENNSKKNVYIAGERIQEKTDLQKSIERGQQVYNGFCVQCHLPNGKGTKGIFPPLDGADWLTEKREVADVMNYIMNSWSNMQNKMVTEEEVKAITN